MIRVGIVPQVASVVNMHGCDAAIADYMMAQ